MVRLVFIADGFRWLTLTLEYYKDSPQKNEKPFCKPKRSSEGDRYNNYLARQWILIIFNHNYRTVAFNF